MRPTLSASANDDAGDGACAMRSIRLALRKSKLVSREKVSVSLHPPRPQTRREEKLQVRLTPSTAQTDSCAPTT